MPEPILTHDDSIPGVRVLGLREKKFISEDQAKRFRNEISQYAPGGEKYDPSRKLVMSFYGTEFFSSSGLNPLIIAEKRLREIGQRLRMVDARREVYEVFAITRLNHLFNMQPNDTLHDYLAERLQDQ